MFGADIIILEFGGLGLRGVEGFAQVASGVRVAAALYLVSSRQFGLQVRFQPCDRHADPFEQIGNKTVCLAHQRQHEVFAVHLLMGIFARDLLSVLQGFLRFLCKFFRLHAPNLAQNRKAQSREISTTTGSRN